MRRVADIVESCREELLGRWTERVQRRLALGGQTGVELEEHLPDFLRELGAALHEPRREAPRGEGRPAREQGARCFRPGFDLEAVVREYDLLREVLFELLEEQGVPVGWGEVGRLTRLLAEASAEAVAEHARRERSVRHERDRLLAETERLMAEAQLELTRMEALFAQAPVAIAIIRGSRLVIELANPLVCRVWGRTSAQVLGKPMLEAMPELVGQGFDELLHRVLATGVAIAGTEVPARLVRAEGAAAEVVYFNFVYEAMRDAQGAIEGVLVVATEVTQGVRARRELEEALARAEKAERARAALMEALAAQSFVGVAYMRGPEHVFEMANRVFDQLVGKPAVVGKPLMEAMPELVGQGIDMLLKQVLQSGEPYMARGLGLQMDIRNRGGLQERLFDFVCQPVRAPDGSIEGVLDLALDVTEQVRARQTAERLAQEHRLRLEFEQQLIGIVSHDLRNPLSVILFGAQALLRREELDPRIARTLVRIQASAERATRMVRDLLDFTQARLGGGLRVERKPTNLYDVTRTVVDEVQASWPEREVRLEAREEPRGEWDGDRLAQVVGNLVTNAVKYSPAGTPVTVRLMGGAEGALLEVHNEGNPIPPEAHERLFQPLQRAVSTIDKAGRSVGLGLYIVEQLVLAHGGRVEVTSDEAHGTTFRVRLPRAS